MCPVLEFGTFPLGGWSPLPHLSNHIQYLVLIYGCNHWWQKKKNNNKMKTKSKKQVTLIYHHMSRQCNHTCLPVYLLISRQINHHTFRPFDVFAAIERTHSNSFWQMKLKEISNKPELFITWLVFYGILQNIRLLWRWPALWQGETGQCHWKPITILRSLADLPNLQGGINKLKIDI